MRKEKQMSKCPNTQRLRQLILWMQESGSEDPRIDEAIQAFYWLLNFLEDRKLYHKKQQLKNKHLLRLAREHGLLDEAEVGAKTELAEVIDLSDEDVTEALAAIKREQENE